MRITKTIIIVALLALSLRMQAQTTFRTQELRRLATALSIDGNQLAEGYQQLTVKGIPLVVHKNENVIDHIGRQLFPVDIRAIDRSPIFDFLERYFLQLSHPPVVKTALNMMHDDQFQFLKGSMKTVADILPTDVFDYAYDHSRYTATWRRDGKVLLSVSFPAEYQLLNGENKIEAEALLQADILNTAVDDSRLIVEDSQRDEHYINSDFTNRLYFLNGELLNSDAHPAETSANMMLCQRMSGNYDLHITQVLYGFNKTEYNVPLRQWIAFCLDSGCKLYYGVEAISDIGDVRAVVLAVNTAENYNHVLTVDIPQHVITDQQGVIPTHLYSYVPTHNVKSLFASFRKSNKKNFAKK